MPKGVCLVITDTNIMIDKKRFNIYLLIYPIYLFIYFMRAFFYQCVDRKRWKGCVFMRDLVKCLNSQLYSRANEPQITREHVLV